METRSRPERLAFLIGGKKKLAEICEVTPPIVTRWCKRGWMGTAYNIRIKRWVAEAVKEMPAEKQAAFVSEIEGYLDAPEICECCGQPLEGRRAI